jgi:hypothetical protein
MTMAAVVHDIAAGPIADRCVLWSGFDIAIVARSYAQLNSFLAGFAFVVINLVLDRAYRHRADGRSPDPREAEHDKLVGIALVCGFLGLMMTALRYSLLAGENGCALTNGRAASAEVLSAVAFGASIYILLYAIVQFIAGAAGMLARHCVFMLTIFVPPIIAFLVEDTLTHLAIALGDSEAQRPLQPFLDWADRLTVPIPLAVLVICAGLWFIGINRRRSESPSSLFAKRFRTIVPYLSVAVAGAVIIRSVLALPYTDPGAHIAPVEAWVWVILLAVVLIVQSGALSFQKGVEVPIIDPAKREVEVVG